MFSLEIPQCTSLVFIKYFMLIPAARHQSDHMFDEVECLEPKYQNLLPVLNCDFFFRKYLCTCVYDKHYDQSAWSCVYNDL